MQAKPALLFFFLLLFIRQGWAQDHKTSSFIGIETGIISYFSEMKEKEYIRRLSSAQANETQSDGFSGSMFTSFIGLKYELMFSDNRWGVATGIRFAKTNSSFGLKGWFHDNSEFFYVLFSEEGTTTEYLATRKLKQEASYIAIPVEVRYVIFSPEYIRFYIKAGAQFDFLTKYTNHITLVYNATTLSKEMAAAQSGTPADFGASVYGGAGMRVGYDSFPIVNVEVTFPAIQLNTNYSSLVKPIAGIGLQAMIQLPLKRKER